MCIAVSIAFTVDILHERNVAGKLSTAEGRASTWRGVLDSVRKLPKCEGATTGMIPLLRQIRYKAKQLVSQPGISPATDIQYAIRSRYQHRAANSTFDATGATEDWQKEVYALAAEEAHRSGANTVFDVGCGSGFKLCQHFSGFHTVGFEIGPTVQYLRMNHPARDWRESDFTATIDEPADIVICADVVEHIPDPDLLMGFLSRLRFGKLFLSTPERWLTYGFDHGGPPANAAHCREWTMTEFASYVSQWFNVEQHLISNRQQATQLVIATAKG